MFFAATGALAVALAWMSWQLVRQDRALAVQRSQERREHAADLTVAALQKNLAQIEEQLRGLSADSVSLPGTGLTPDSALLVITAGELQVHPRGRLLFYPETTPAKAPPAAMFAHVDELEFRRQDYVQASAALRDLAREAGPTIRAEALMRLGRNYSKAGKAAESLAAYAELARFDPGTRIRGLPAALLAREARLLALEKQGEIGALRREAAEFCSMLRSGAWTINRGSYEFYKNEACARAGVVLPDAVEAVALSSAVVSWWEQWPEIGLDEAGGRRLFWENDLPVLLLWRRSGEKIAALAAGPGFLRSAWLQPVQRMLEEEGIRIALTDPDGRAVFGSAANGGGNESVRLTPVAQLPLTLHAISVTPAITSGDAARRRLVLTAALTLFLLVAGGWYFIGRAAVREMAVARLQSDFVAAVSHEFRTPITALRQLSELLAGGRVETEQDRDEYYRALSRESERLHRLVEGLLNFGRAEADAMQYRMEKLDAAEFLQTAVSEFRGDSERRGYRVELNTNGAAPMVRADRAALGCVLRNLLDNAVNYSPESFTIWVELGREKERVAFRVRDRGIGIPAGEQEQIFQKFVRGAEAKARSIRGAGIGLAMARQIVAHHKGEIDVESRPGQGSTFTVLLPEAME